MSRNRFEPPVAIVAAETYDQAFQAAKLVKVDYEELGPILTIKEAMAHEEFTYNPPTVIRGDPDLAMENAAHRLQGELKCGVLA